MNQYLFALKSSARSWGCEFYVHVRNEHYRRAVEGRSEQNLHLAMSLSLAQPAIFVSLGYNRVFESVLLREKSISLPCWHSVPLFCRRVI